MYLVCALESACVKGSGRMPLCVQKESIRQDAHSVCVSNERMPRRGCMSISAYAGVRSPNGSVVASLLSCDPSASARVCKKEEERKRAPLGACMSPSASLGCKK